MKSLIAVLAVVVFVAPTLGGQNPNIAIFLNSEESGQGTNEICPAPGEFFHVYVCFDRFSPAGGLGGFALRFERTFEGFLIHQWLLAGWGMGWGGIEESGYNAAGLCVYPDPNGIVVPLAIEYLYTDGPGTITALGHADLGNMTWDCNHDTDPWCVASLASHGFSGHFGVCAPPPETRVGDCEPIVTPVEDGSWGTIKTLYR